MSLYLKLLIIFKVEWVIAFFHKLVQVENRCIKSIYLLISTQSGSIGSRERDQREGVAGHHVETQRRAANTDEHIRADATRYRWIACRVGCIVTCKRWRTRQFNRSMPGFSKPAPVQPPARLHFAGWIGADDPAFERARHSHHSRPDAARAAIWRQLPLLAGRQRLWCQVSFLFQ